jgi:hypothetical protein
VPMLEGHIDHVIGVDTHRDAHAAAILDRNGGLLAKLEVSSSQAGYEELLGVVAPRGFMECARNSPTSRSRRLVGGVATGVPGSPSTRQ